jgi:DNA-binding transcriptional LysR family regulator
MASMGGRTSTPTTSLRGGEVAARARRMVVTLPGLFLYYSNRRHSQPALRAFIDCLLDEDT